MSNDPFSKGCLFVDGKGVPFGRYRDLLPKHAAAFPRPRRVVDSTLRRRYHFIWDHCQSCGVDRTDAVLQMHHLFAGRHGKNDELSAVIMTCVECHERYGPQSESNVGYLLFRKWATDRRNTDWIRSALLRCCFLPDLVVDLDGHRRYLERRGVLVLPQGS